MFVATSFFNLSDWTVAFQSDDDVMSRYRRHKNDVIIDDNDNDDSNYSDDDDKNDDDDDDDDHEDDDHDDDDDCCGKPESIFGPDKDFRLSQEIVFFSYSTTKSSFRMIRN